MSNTPRETRIVAGTEVVRVLIADRSAEVRAAIELTVRAELPGAQIQLVGTGPEALGVLRGQEPDIVIIDVALPVMSGIDVVGAARREGMRPFLILTSDNVLPNWAMLSTDLYAYEFLKKPFVDSDMSQLLRSFLRMREPTRILIADAVDQTRAIMHKIVQASRFQTQCELVDHGGHVLKLARLQPFDMALIDTNLRGTSGLETACQLQTAYPAMTVVAVLPSTDTSLITSIKHLGLPNALNKPFYTRDIDVLLHQAHGLRRPYLMNAVMKATVAALTG